MMIAFIAPVAKITIQIKMNRIISVGYKDYMENPQIATVGEYVEKIEEHQPQGEGDKWYWEIYWKDGRQTTIFNATIVERRAITADDIPF